MRSRPIPWPRSLRLQLVAAYVIALLLTVATGSAIMYGLLVINDDAVVRKGLALQVRWIDEALRFDATGKPFLLDGEAYHSWIYDSASDDVKFVLLDAAGAVLLGSGAAPQALAPAGHPFDPARSQFHLASGPVPVHVLTAPIQRNGSTYHVQVARSDRVQDLTIRTVAKPVLRTTLYVALASLLVLAAVVYFTVQRMLRPLRLASQAAAAVTPRNLSKRLDGAGLPTELAPLVDAFNLALARLEQGFRVQQEFLSGAAHELKTPLALIRAQIECDGIGTDRTALLQDVDVMARHVNQLLHLAEASEAQNYVFAPTSVTEVATEATRYLARLADQRQVCLQLSDRTSAGHRVQADASAVFVLLKNLIENAIRHSPAGGVVTVAVDAAGVSVQDTGAGIPAADLPKVFDRYWRSAERRDDGAGLGLAICLQIASTHGWHLDAQNLAPGARFTVDMAGAATA